MARKLKPVHPGEILSEEFMEPLGLNANKLSIALRVSAPSVYEIAREERSISPDMALRLGRYFNTTPEFWLNLQTRYDLEIARGKEAAKVEREIEPLKTATAHLAETGVTHGEGRIRADQGKRDLVRAVRRCDGQDSAREGRNPEHGKASISEA